MQAMHRRWRRALAVAGAGLLVGALPFPSPGAETVRGTSSAPRDGLVIEENAPFGIYLASAAGGKATPLLLSMTQESTHPRVSPDGQWVVFTRYHQKDASGRATEQGGYANTEIALMRIDGSGVVSIVPPKPGIMASGASWSPDGTSIVYTSTDTLFRTPEIRRIDFAARTVQRMPTPFGLSVADPHWVGNRLVFPSKDSEADALWIMNVNGTQAQRITNPLKRGFLYTGPNGDFDPKLSPDGRRVAFMRIASFEPWRIITLELATGAETALTRPGEVEGLPDWSPDGKRLLHVRYDPANPAVSSLWTMTADGQGRQRIALPEGRLYGHPSYVPATAAFPEPRIIFTMTRKPAS